MTEAGQTAYVTGGASGIGRAITEMLVAKGAKVYIADRDVPGATALASALNASLPTPLIQAGALDVISWEQQEAAFVAALAALGGRIDYVYPIAGIGERAWIPNTPQTPGFVKPDLTVLDADLTGVMYTVALAVQQFRRQEVGRFGFRGKIGCVASVCGFYCVPTLPIYTSAKHAVTGFVRSYGKYLPEERITMNAVNPNVIRTNISVGAFYDKLEGMGLLTPMAPLVDAFASFLGDSAVSGEIFEVPPSGKVTVREAPGYLDAPSKEVCELLYTRAHALHEPKA